MKKRAITFDFWDTLAKDESDEPKRSARGWRSKPEARLELLWKEIHAHHKMLERGSVESAFAHANKVFTDLWKNKACTLRVSERLSIAYDELNLDLTPGFGALVAQFENMELEIAPDPVEDLAPVLESLARSYRLGIISDTIHTPGRGLRELLKQWKVLQYFSGFVFSDEVGASKPNAKVFREAARQLGVKCEECIHIGDREDKDVVGAQGVGASSVLLTAIKDRRDTKRASAASAICERFGSLPNVIEELCRKN